LSVTSCRSTAPLTLSVGHMASPTSFDRVVGYAFGATKGVLQSQDPFGIPGLLVVRASHPRNREGRLRASWASVVSPGGDPFAASSDDRVLVDDVGSVAGANHTRDVQFIERFADAGSPEVV